MKACITPVIMKKSKWLYFSAGVVYESAYRDAYEMEYESSKSEAKTAAVAKYTQETCPDRKATEINNTCDLEQAIAQARIQATQNRNTALANAQTETAKSLFTELEFCIVLTHVKDCSKADSCFYSTSHGNKCIPVSLAV